MNTWPPTQTFFGGTRDEPKEGLRRRLVHKLYLSYAVPWGMAHTSENNTEINLKLTWATCL